MEARQHPERCLDFVPAFDSAAHRRMVFKEEVGTGVRLGRLRHLINESGSTMEMLWRSLRRPGRIVGDERKEMAGGSRMEIGGLLTMFSRTCPATIGKGASHATSRPLSPPARRCSFLGNCQRFRSGSRKTGPSRSLWNPAATRPAAPCGFDVPRSPATFFTTRFHRPPFRGSMHVHSFLSRKTGRIP